MSFEIFEGETSENDLVQRVGNRRYELVYDEETKRMIVVGQQERQYAFQKKITVNEGKQSARKDAMRERLREKLARKQTK